MTEKITCVCNLITRWNGEILSLYCIGSQAEELTRLIVLAIHRKITIQDLAYLSPPSPNIYRLLSGIVHQW